MFRPFLIGLVATFLLSVPLSAGRPLPTTLYTDKNSYVVGEKIVVTFRGAPTSKKAKGKDWITVVPASHPANKYGEWKYTNGQYAGKMEFKTPLKPGKYEVRLYFNWPTGKYVIQRRHSFVARQKKGMPHSRKSP